MGNCRENLVLLPTNHTSQTALRTQGNVVWFPMHSNGQQGTDCLPPLKAAGVKKNWETLGYLILAPHQQPHHTPKRIREIYSPPLPQWFSREFHFLFMVEKGVLNRASTPPTFLLQTVLKIQPCITSFPIRPLWLDIRLILSALCRVNISFKIWDFGRQPAFTEPRKIFRLRN